MALTHDPSEKLPQTPVRRRKVRRNDTYKVDTSTGASEKTFAVVIEGEAPDSYETVQKLAAAIHMSVREVGVSVSVRPVFRTGRAEPYDSSIQRHGTFSVGSDRVTKRASSPSTKQLEKFEVTSLFDSSSGRLNAKQISAAFAVPLTTIATAAGTSLSAASRTPDSSALQPTLRMFYRIAAALAILVGTIEGLRIWMNQPSRLLDGKTPWEVIDAGEGEVVALVLESMVVGEPA